MRRPNSGAVAMLVAASTLAYMLPLRSYGLTLEDEGTLLYQIVRVTRGELPYVDFSTGYTPGYFALNAVLWRVAGNVVGLRVAVALLHALTAGGLALLIGRVARPSLALVVPLLYVAFIPVFPGEFCAFNVPYPAWYATLGWVATAATMLAWRRRCARGWLVLAGTCAAVTLMIKPNAGLFAVAAATAVLLELGADSDRGRRANADGGVPPGASAGAPGARVATVAWWALWVVVGGGVAATFGIRVRALDAIVYLAPVAALLVLSARPGVRPHAGLVGDALALLVPFVALSVPWIAFFYRLLGRAGFAREVLLLGTGSEEIFYVPYPALTSWGALAAVVVCGFAVAGRMVARRRVTARAATAVGTLVVLGVAAVIATIGVMPEGLVPSLVWQLESAAFALVLLAHFAGVAWLARRGATGMDEPVLVLLVFGIFMHLQLYPRTDFMHLVIAAPLTAALASALLERVVRDWEGASPRRPWAARGVVVALAVLVALGASRGIAVLWSRPWVAFPFAVAPLAVEERHARDHRDLAAAALALAAHVPPGAPSLGFPALDATLLLTGARNPGPHGYFFPGRPDHREEAEMVDAIVRDSPEAMASQNGSFAFFDGAPPYYFLLRRYVRHAYGLAERHGRFDIVVRGAAAVSSAVSAPGAVPPAGGATLASLIATIGGTDAADREAAVAALLDQVAARPERGLEDVLAGVSLDLRTRVLLVRTIRDTRDTRAASYLFAALTDPQPRARRAVLEAMASTRAELIARRYLWAGTLRPEVWPAAESLRRRVAATLVDADAPDAARAFAAYLAGELGATESVPVLRRLLESAVETRGASSLAPADRAPAAAETVASAAAALALLAPRDLACTLATLLPRPEPALRVLVPSLLLDLADRPETAAEARGCLRDALARGGDAGEQAAWIAAALADGTVDDALRGALAGTSPGQRRASTWALGEAPYSSATEQALAAVTADDDPIVRVLAARALDKQGGRAPRAFATARPSGDGAHLPFPTRTDSR